MQYYYCNLKLTVNACKSILTKKLKYKIVLQLAWKSAHSTDNTFAMVTALLSRVTM